MKQIIFFLLFLPSILFGQSFTAPIVYRTGVPTAPPSSSGSRYYQNLTTGFLYQWDQSASWNKVADGIDVISGSAAPAYTPGIADSRFAINADNKMYRHNGSIWDEVFSDQTISLSGDTLTLSNGGGSVVLPGGGDGIYGGSGVVDGTTIAYISCFDTLVFQGHTIINSSICEPPPIVDSVSICVERASMVVNIDGFMVLSFDGNIEESLSDYIGGTVILNGDCGNYPNVIDTIYFNSPASSTYIVLDTIFSSCEHGLCVFFEKQTDSPDYIKGLGVFGLAEFKGLIDTNIIALDSIKLFQTLYQPSITDTTSRFRVSIADSSAFYNRFDSVQINFAAQGIFGWFLIDSAIFVDGATWVYLASNFGGSEEPIDSVIFYVYYFAPYDYGVEISDKPALYTSDMKNRIVTNDRFIPDVGSVKEIIKTPFRVVNQIDTLRKSDSFLYVCGACPTSYSTTPEVYIYPSLLDNPFSGIVKQYTISSNLASFDTKLYLEEGGVWLVNGLTNYTLTFKTSVTFIIVEGQGFIIASTP